MAIENTMDKNTYTIYSNKEFINDFNENLLKQIGNKSSLKIEIMNADYEKGLLSIRVTEKYKHLVGKEGKIVVTKTVIMEQTDAKIKMHRISFYCDRTKCPSQFLNKVSQNGFVKSVIINEKEKIKLPSVVNSMLKSSRGAECMKCTQEYTQNQSFDEIVNAEKQKDSNAKVTDFSNVKNTIDKDTFVAKDDIVVKIEF